MPVTLIEETDLSRGTSRNIRKTILPNGLTVLTESMPHHRSVSMGAWIASGSRDEASEINGISHFIEHMVFKGTTSRSAQQIAREVDTIGGNLDAFTSKEMVCFNIKVLDEQVAPALDILADLVLHPTFTPEELNRELGVILEEIKMDEDNPDFLVHEIFTQNLWKGHPLGKPILGTKETVGRLEQAKLFGYYGDRFRAGNIVFTAAGNLDHQRFVDEVRRRFEAMPAGIPEDVSLPPTATAKVVLRNKKALEQVQLCMGVPSLPISSERRYVALLLNTVLGGGMSSRLFQTVREERGLAYSIYSDLSPYKDTGMLCVYAGTSSDRALQVIQLVTEEFRRMKQENMPEDELRRAKDQLLGNIILSMESTGARMSNLARQEMYFDHFFGVDEVMQQVEAVTSEQVTELARELFVPDKIAVTMLGRLDGIKVGRRDLIC